MAWAEEFLQHYIFVGCGSWPIRPCGFKPGPKFGSLPQPFLPEKFYGIIINLITHDEVGSPGQFVGQGFGSDDIFGLSQLALVEAFGMRAVSAGKVGGLDKSPAEILVSVFAIALAFLFIVGEMLA